MFEDNIVRIMLLLVLIFAIYKLFRLKKDRKPYQEMQNNLGIKKGNMLLKISSKSLKDLGDQYGSFFIALTILGIIVPIFVFVLYASLGFEGSEVLLVILFIVCLFLIVTRFKGITNLYKNKIRFYEKCFEYGIYYSYKDVNQFRFEKNKLVITMKDNKYQDIVIKNLTSNEIEKIKNIRNIVNECNTLQIAQL